MLRQIQKINNKIKSNNYYFYCFILAVCYNYYSLYNYLLDKNYNLLLLYFIYLFLLYSFFNLFSYFITFVTLGIFQLLTIDNYIKNSYIVENHEPDSVRNYRIQRRQQARQQQRQQARQQQQYRPRNSSYQGSIANNEAGEESLGDRVQSAADNKGRAIEDEARGASANEGEKPDPAYQYIIAHLPDCGREMLSLTSLPDKMIEDKKRSNNLN